MADNRPLEERICSIPDCGEPVLVLARGWCRVHYHRWHRTGDPLLVRPPGAPGGICSVPDCGRPRHGQGYCTKHYQRYRRIGKTELRTALERFWEKVDRRGDDECWPWLASTDEHGYGQFGTGSRTGTMAKAHLWIYQQMVGPVPVGLDLDHGCHNADKTCPGGKACLHRRCVNYVKHLAPATRSDNIRRGLNRTTD